MKRILLLSLVLISFATSILAQTYTPATSTVSVDKIFGNKPEMVFTFWVADKNQINTDLTKIISIDQVMPAVNGGYNVRAYANKREFVEFLNRNIPWEPFTEPNAGKAYTMATTTAQMAAWDRYPTYTVYKQMMLDFASNYPSICNLDTILAVTPDNHQILVLKISDNVTTKENEPRFLYSSSIHGDETTGFILMLRLASYLLTNYVTLSRVTDFVNNVEIWICPLANPDGTYYSSDNTIGSSPISTRSNSAGVDMNRNYPDPLDGDHPDGEAWQPETQAFMTFANAHHFNMSANFHGGAEVMNYPWDTWTSSGNPNASAAWWERVCTAYVDTSRLVDGSYLSDTYADGVTEGGDWYVINGGRQDYMNYFQYCREVTIELDGTKTTGTENLNAAWNRNYRALLNYIQESRYGLRGIITDSCTGLPIKAKVWVNTYDQTNDSSQVYSWLPVGDYHKYLTAGTYSVTFSAPGYISKTITNVVTTNTSANTLNVSLAPALPDANFMADVVSTCSGVVNFSDLTSGGANTWTWNFGDGYGSSAQNPIHQYNTNGTYTVTLSAGNCKGNNVETKPAYITVSLATVPVVSGASHCGPGSVTLGATGSGTLNWYDDATGGSLVNTGPSYITPGLTTTTSYYVESIVSNPSVYGAKTDNSGGGGNLTNQNQYEIFDCYTPLTLVSVDVYASTTGDRIFELRNSSGVVLQTATVNITSTSGAFTVPLGFSVPAGTDLQLGLSSSSTCNLYRNNVGVAYPYTTAGLLSVTTSSAGTTPEIYYYYFYHWQLQEPGCNSARIEVLATINPVSVASFTQSIASPLVTFTNTSQNAVSYAWDFGDGQTSTQSDPVHNYSVEGLYDVRLITTNPCGNDTAYSTVNIVLTGGLADVNSAQQVSIYPNPANNVIHLSLNALTTQDCRYEIINMVGEVALRGAVTFRSGSSTASIEIDQLGQGVYFIKLMMDSGSVIRKIIVE